MKEISMLHQMQPSKETDNKLRWEACDQDFKLYIPKWRVPQPWPIRIVVRLDDDPRSFGSVSAPGGPESAQARNLHEPLTDRRAGGGGQSDTQGDNVGGANRCI